MLSFIRDNTFLDIDEKPNFILYFILLNRPFVKSTFIDLYNKCAMFICADGGSNRLFDAFSTEEERLKYLPHIILGDMDSIRPEVRQYYEERGTKILYNKDQDTSDMEKCVYFVFENSETIQKNEKRDSPKNVLMQDNFSYSKLIILGAFGGRIDQTLASIHVLYKMNTLFKEKCRENEIILMDDYSMMIFLEEGHNIIRLSQKYESKTGVGLIPIVHKVSKIQTSGLKLNLGNPGDNINYLDFKDSINTSNGIIGDEIQIKNSHPILFCTTLNESRRQ